MKKIMITALTITLIGCAASGPKYAEMSFEQTRDMSEVFIFRLKQFVDGGTCYELQLDDEAIGVLANGGFLRLEVPPGKHEITVPMPNKNSIDLSADLLANKTAYFQLNTALNNSKAIPESEKVSEISDFHYSQGLALNYNYGFAQVKAAYAKEKLAPLSDSSTNPSCMATLRVEN